MSAGLPSSRSPQVIPIVLTAKPHAFCGAVLSPKHSRELTPTLCLDIVSALSSEPTRKTIIPYTVWITEAWRVLGWAEPSAALFWEMATMYHTLYVARRERCDEGEIIPPILSVGSHSSMGSAQPTVHSANAAASGNTNVDSSKSNKKQYSTAAKELPVWIVGTFLLLHCEESAYRRNLSAEETGQTEIQFTWKQKNMAWRTRTQSGHQDHCTAYILRHLRKFLLLLAMPHSEDAVKACLHLAALPPSNTSSSQDVNILEQRHKEEHGTIGLGMTLTMEELQRLQFILQPPSGGGVDDPPLDIAKYLWKALYKTSTLPSEGSMPLNDVEHVIRQQLSSSLQSMDIRLSNLSLEERRDPNKPDVYQKELAYTQFRSTTIILRPDTAETRHLHDLVISDCNDCHFYLLQPFEHVSITGCTNCTIVVGAVAGLLFVVDCEKTHLTSAVRRLLVSNSSDVLLHIFTPSPPLMVGDNRNCQLAPYNSYYEGLREDLLATGLAAAVVQEPPPSPGGNQSSPTAAMWPLQCASNKWKQPVELSKMELPQMDENNSQTSTDDAAMQTPILLPASEFHILFVPLPSELSPTKSGGDAMESQYCQLLAQVLQLCPFRLPVEYERQALAKADRMRALQTAMKKLTPEQQTQFIEELNRGFRDWLVSSGNLRQVLDLVNLDQSGTV